MIRRPPRSTLFPYNDALPISPSCSALGPSPHSGGRPPEWVKVADHHAAQPWRSEEHTSELQSRQYLVCRLLLEKKKRKITALYPRYNGRAHYGTPSTPIYAMM